MAMYICHDCYEKYKLPIDITATAIAACEICGHLQGDWHVKQVALTTRLHRFSDVQAQLDALRAA